MINNVPIYVVIPTYKCSTTILRVLHEIPSYIDRILVIDDKCPENSGKLVLDNVSDPRVVVIFNNENLGVGGATKSGYLEILKTKESAIVVKLDGDDQMNSDLISKMVEPLIKLKADYVKGNRFNNINSILTMPKLRIIGNLVLTFLSKLSSGYWQVFDPTNGFVAVSTDILRLVPLNKVSNRYFFESDMLFRLNLISAVVVDFPMDSKYGQEKSNLKIWKVALEFPVKHFVNFFKRICYNYYLRDFTLASLELPLGLVLTTYGTILGIINFLQNASINTPTPIGTLMLVSMSILVGLQLLLGFASYDVNNSPKTPIGNGY